MGPTWGPPGSCRPQMGPILAPWTLLSGKFSDQWKYGYCQTYLKTWKKNKEIVSIFVDTVSTEPPEGPAPSDTNHYIGVMMGTMASQITILAIVYSTVYSSADHRKHQSSASPAFVWGIHRRPVNSPHKWPVTRKMFPFDDFINARYICRYRDQQVQVSYVYERDTWSVNFSYYGNCKVCISAELGDNTP